MKPHSYSLEQLGGGLPVIAIELGPELTGDNVIPLVEGVTAQAAKLEGRPFTMLMDTRQVKKASEEALGALQSLEMELAGKGVERIAHVVRFKDMAAKLAKTYEEIGYPDLYGTFTELNPAHAFLAGGDAGEEGAEQ